MTCYETLTIREAPPPPVSAADAPMAHHLVKWWRNKFRSGYKKFHLGTESERTDTEELVGRAASQCSAPPDLLPSEARAHLQPQSPELRVRCRPRRCRTPSPPPADAYTPRLPSPLIPHILAPPASAAPPAPSAPTPAPPPQPPPPPPPESAHNPQSQKLHQEKPPRLRFEELTCDVSVHESASRQKPLQFSFTLYDLDGHGRMTKDDIAGIVSTIYESVGKSVTVPHYGSKTIQVRLTVVPESPATAAERGGSGGRREGRRRPRRRRDTAGATKPDCGDATDDERRSRLSVDDDSSCSGDSRRVRARPPRPRPGAGASAHSAPPTPPTTRPRHAHAHREARERRANKKRSGSLQRRELLQIIQANMEKNHLSFQTSRKPIERVIQEEEIINVNHRHRNRAFTISAKPSAAAASSSSPLHKVKSELHNNGYLDLAHTPSADSNLCRYDRYLHAVICSSATHANSGYHHHHLPTTPPVPVHTPPPKPHHHKIPKTHHRSRSHDVPPPPRAAPDEPRVLQIIFL